MTRKSVGLLLLLLTCLWSCSPGGIEGESESAPAEEVANNPAINIEMVYIPAGTFIMGSSNADDEKPAHEVSVSGFYIGKYVVTQREWRAVMGYNPSAVIGEDHPVEDVSWVEAQSFAEKLSEMTGQRYRLPTEAEWEYAARAGSTTTFHFGDDPEELGEYAWYDANSGGTSHPVGQKRPNGWGLYDMAGNVREWCQDWWDPGYYERSEYENPVNEDEYLYTSPTTDEQFVARATRSGSYLDIPSGNESAHRHGGRPERGQHVTGFRLVREPAS